MHISLMAPFSKLAWKYSYIKPQKVPHSHDWWNTAELILQLPINMMNGAVEHIGPLYSIILGNTHYLGFIQLNYKALFILQKFLKLKYMKCLPFVSRKTINYAFF
jgi:hypothetical protein